MNNHEQILNSIMHQVNWWANKSAAPLFYNKHEVLRRGDALRIKSKFYYTGKLCSRGHVTLRRSDTGHCIICHSHWRNGGDKPFLTNKPERR